jgi:zinc transport system substrate-binding protein
MRIVFLAASVLLATSLKAEVPRVAVDIAPVHGMVSQVMAGIGRPDLVIPPGASPHGYAMRPSEARALSQADLVIWIGPALTPWMEEPLEALASDAQRLTLADVPGLTRHPMRQGAAFDAHDHGHDHGHGDDHGDEAVLDPHLWLDPENAIVWLAAIADTLASIDPDHAEDYRANAKRAQADLGVLADQLKADLDVVKGRPFIVFHDAYHYFEARFGIEAVAAITLGDAGTASAARLRQVRDMVRDTGASCALAEPAASAGLIEAVSDSAEIRVVELDPLGLGISLGPEFYPSLLKLASGALVTCLSDKK